MALDQPFTWGANGARMTPEDIAAQRKVADALAAQAGDASPFPTGTRGFGEVTQGLNRLAKGVMAGLDYREADAASKANDDDNKALIAALLGGGAAPSTSIATSGSTAVSAPAASGAAPVLGVPTTAPEPVPTNYRKWSAAELADPVDHNPQPEPLDPPTGQDRVNMIATALGEEKPGSPESLGVINTIRNRAIDGGYGGITPTAVVTAPKQYSPWNDASGRARMASALQNPDAVAKVSDAIDQAYGVGKYVSAGPNDPTEGKTHFYDPGSMVPVNAVPTWAQGRPFQTIGSTRFLDDPDEPIQVASTPAVAKVAAASGAPVVASDDPAALPAASTPTQGYAIPGQAAAPTPAVAKVSGAIGGVNPAVVSALTSPYASEGTKKIAGLVLSQQLAAAGKERYTQETDADGNVWNVNNTTGQKTVAKAAEKDPASVQEYEYYKKNVPDGQPVMDYGTYSDHKARAAATNVTTNVDMNSGQTYDKQLAEGLGKSHAALANGVEDAQSRARDIAAMQGAVDAIQKNGGTTGGLAPAQRLELQKSINAGAAALGIEKPFDESDLSDKEFLTKFNRSMAGAQAKNSVGNRVTNFEMTNFLKANPGLDMTITGNQRLLGIQSQIEQRNIAVGNAIRDATAQAISTGKKIDPVTVQHIISKYDEEHHIQDPTTGQDLTQSYALPEFQQGGSNAALAVGHEANINGIKIKRLN